MDEVTQFISCLENETRRADSFTLLAVLTELTGYKPYLIGKIIGFGTYHYKYDSGREGDSAVIAFSPRKQNLVIYLMPGFDMFSDLLNDLGKHKLGKSCLYINKLTEINLDTFKEIAKLSVQDMQQRYPCKNPE